MSPLALVDDHEPSRIGRVDARDHADAAQADARRAIERAMVLRRRQHRQTLLLLGIRRSGRRIENKVDHVVTEMQAIGGTVADIEAYLVVRDARTARKTAITTSSATGAVVVVVSVLLKLIFGV